MKQKGFTLIEVLIALAITGTLAILLFSSSSSSNQRIRKASLNNNIAHLLTRKMTEMEAKNSNKKPSEISDEEGNFGDDFPNYTWSFKAKALEIPDLSPLVAGPDGVADQTLLTMINKLREAANKAIVEATVTVTAMVNGKAVSHSVTTYFVDFESEPDLGM